MTPSVWDNEFSQCARSSMYRAWVSPESYPDERQPVLKNWPVEDLEDYFIRKDEVAAN